MESAEFKDVESVRCVRSVLRHGSRQGVKQFCVCRVPVSFLIDTIPHGYSIYGFLYAIIPVWPARDNGSRLGAQGHGADG